MRRKRAAQTPRTPPVGPDDDGEAGGAHRKGDRHRQGEIATVAGADQDAVDGEDDAVERLHQREQRPQQRALVEHLGIRRERAGDHAGEARRTTLKAAPTMTESQIMRTLAS